MAVEEVAASRYLYAPKRGEHRDHSVDERLQDLENLLGRIWPAVAEGYVPLASPPIRMALSLFIATLYTRHPQRIANITRLHADLISAFDKFPKDAEGNPAITEVIHQGEARPFDATDWQRYVKAGKAEHKQAFVDTIIRDSGTIAEILLEKRFAIVTTAYAEFATGDSPLVVTNRSYDRFGFRTKDTVIHLPLSPTRYLILEDSGLPDGYYESQGEFPEAMNYQTWCASDRYLLSSIESDKVLAGIMGFADRHGGA